MLEFILILLLLLLWLLGYIHVPLTHTTLFTVGKSLFTLNDLLLTLVIFWLVSLLPRPFQDLALVLFLLWLLSGLGLIEIAGFGNLVVLAFIVGLIVYLFQNRPRAT